MNKDKVKLFICAMVCVTFIIVGILFWPTLYRYDSMKDGKKTIPVRINRITGATEILLVESGWKPVLQLEPFNPKDYSVPKLLPTEEKAKIIGEKSVLSELYQIGESSLPNGTYVSIPDKKDFIFKSELYNGSEWNIVNELMVVIEAKNKDGTTRWKRRYKANIIGGSINPFSSGAIIVETSDVYGLAAYIWFIDEAYGWKTK